MSKRLIEKFWTAMATNEFGKASGLLAPEYEYYMPQTTEYIRGPEAFAALNSAYPTDGTWTFNIRSIVAEHDTAVSDVAVSDGTLSARAITFHTVEAGLIVRQIEYWPEKYPAPDWRKQWVTCRETFPG